MTLFRDTDAAAEFIAPAGTEGRKPLTLAQLYSAAHPKINGPLRHKGIDRDVTLCNSLVIGTVRCGDTQMGYTLHMELTDGTLDLAFTSCPNKATAMRIAKVIAKSASFECARLIVNDKNDMTVASFLLPVWTA